MEKLDMNGKTPLPLCKHCLGKNITPPTTQAATNFFVKAKQKRDAKKRKLDEVVEKGFRKGRGARKAKK